MGRQLAKLVLALLALWPLGVRADELRVYFFDVGHGDATLIVSPTGKTVLIDAGPPEAAARLRARLDGLLSAPLDLAILTHAHADHMGGMVQALGVRGAQLFVDSGFEHPSATHDALFKYLEAQKIRAVNARVGQQFDLGGGAELTLLGPAQPFLSGTASDTNANSVVARVTYGRRAVLFMGDGEVEAERALLSRGGSLASDIVKIGHHGGRAAAGSAFLDAVHPSMAVISVGAGNGLGLPSRGPIDRLEAARVRVLRTDLDGEIRVSTDGTRLTVRTGDDGESVALAALPAPTPAPADHGRAKPPHAGDHPDHVDHAAPADPDPLPEAGVKVIEMPQTTPVSANTGGHHAKAYVASSKSGVFHKAECTWAKRIKPENLEQFDTREAAISSGREPAGCCHP